MAPFNLPWSTFGAFVVLACTIALVQKGHEVTVYDRAAGPGGTPDSDDLRQVGLDIKRINLR